MMRNWAMKRLSAVKWGIVGRMVWAWVLTLPVTAIVGYWMMKICLYWFHTGQP